MKLKVALLVTTVIFTVVTARLGHQKHVLQTKAGFTCSDLLTNLPKGPQDLQWLKNFDQTKRSSIASEFHREITDVGGEGNGNPTFQEWWKLRMMDDVAAFTALNNVGNVIAIGASPMDANIFMMSANTVQQGQDTLADKIFTAIKAWWKDGSYTATTFTNELPQESVMEGNQGQMEKERTRLVKRLEKRLNRLIQLKGVQVNQEFPKEFKEPTAWMASFIKDFNLPNALTPANKKATSKLIYELAREVPFFFSFEVFQVVPNPKGEHAEMVLIQYFEKNPSVDLRVMLGVSKPACQKCQAGYALLRNSPTKVNHYLYTDVGKMMWPNWKVPQFVPGLLQQMEGNSATYKCWTALSKLALVVPSFWDNWKFTAAGYLEDFAGFGGKTTTTVELGDEHRDYVTGWTDGQNDRKEGQSKPNQQNMSADYIAGYAAGTAGDAYRPETNDFVVKAKQ